MSMSDLTLSDDSSRSGQAAPSTDALSEACIDGGSTDESALADWRAQIDRLDTQLLELIVQRQQIVCAIGEYKRARGLTPLDSKRWRQMLAANLAKGEALGLCTDFVNNLYHLIHNYSLRLESEQGELS